MKEEIAPFIAPLQNPFNAFPPVAALIPAPIPPPIKAVAPTRVAIPVPAVTAEIATAAVTTVAVMKNFSNIFFYDHLSIHQLYLLHLLHFESLY